MKMWLIIQLTVIFGRRVATRTYLRRGHPVHKQVFQLGDWEVVQEWEIYES